MSLILKKQASKIDLNKNDTVILFYNKSSDKEKSNILNSNILSAENLKYINEYLKHSDIKSYFKYILLHLNPPKCNAKILLINNSKKLSSQPNIKTLFEETIYQNILSATKYIKDNHSNIKNIYIDLAVFIDESLNNKSNLSKKNKNNKETQENYKKLIIKSHINACAQLQQKLEYCFDQFKSDKNKSNSQEKNDIFDFVIYTSNTLLEHKNIIAKQIKISNAANNAIKLCRDLGNTPPNICNPMYLAYISKQLAKKHSSITIKILEDAMLRKMGMFCLVSVGQGSETPAKLIDFHYTHPSCKNDDPIILIGKGVTFDSGGLSLKGAGSMLGMHLDMCGAASVISTLQACAELNLKINLRVLVPTVENMPDARSYRPSDIIKSYDGKMVEITNTDAEGRLILCDTLSYANQKYSPKAMIDLATLTGAIIIALGHDYTGLFSNNDDLAAQLLQAGVESQDLAWQLPLHPDYIKPLKSHFADLKNCGDRTAGSMTAAQYLASFIGDCDNWAHLDIAGTAMGEKGGTGRAVNLLLQYLLNQEKA
tara:strand:- start:2907 stop:4529 length:1623 start_codon:yes stop_codon:yes gene_type:complete